MSALDFLATPENRKVSLNIIQWMIVVYLVYFFVTWGKQFKKFWERTKK
jgi:hypothetical protein